MKIKLSKSQWEKIGNEAGWLKTADGYGRFSGDLSDIIETQVKIHGRQNKNAKEIFDIIKELISKNTSLAEMIKEERMTDTELLGLINDYLQLNAEMSSLGTSLLRVIKM